MVLLDSSGKLCGTWDEKYLIDSPLILLTSFFQLLGQVVQHSKTGSVDMK